MSTHRVVAFGELLWDVLPSGKVLGGAPANFAFRLRELGVPVRLISRVGDDVLGREALSMLHAHRVPTADIQIDSKFPTGTVDVELKEHGVPDFTINPGVAYDQIQATPEAFEAIAEASAICFGSLVQRSARARESLYSLLDKAPHATKVLDVNLRKDCWTADTVAASLERADIAKLNEDESGVLGELFALPGGTLREFCESLLSKFSLKACVVTRGADGVCPRCLGH